MALDRLIEEVKQVGLVTLYFLACFTLVLTLKKLFLAEYAVQFYGVSAAIVAALVVGKVVVLCEGATKKGGLSSLSPLLVRSEGADPLESSDELTP